MIGIRVTISKLNHLNDSTIFTLCVTISRFNRTRVASKQNKWIKKTYIRHRRTYSCLHSVTLFIFVFFERIYLFIYLFLNKAIAIYCSQTHVFVPRLYLCSTNKRKHAPHLYEEDSIRSSGEEAAMERISCVESCRAHAVANRKIPSRSWKAGVVDSAPALETADLPRGCSESENHAIRLSRSFFFFFFQEF